MKTLATISPVQLFFILLQAQIGIGLLSLPFTVHEEAGKDGWISVLLAGFLIQGGIAVICLLSSRFPNLTFSEFAPLLVGRMIGNLLTILYILFFFSTVCHILATFLTISSNWAYAKTPHLIFAFLSIAVAVYLVKENFRTIARFLVLISFLLPLIFIMVLTVIPNFNIQYLLPVASNGMGTIMKAAGITASTFAGFEILLWLYAFTEGSGKAKWKATAWANALTTLIYASVVIAAYGSFSPDEIKIIPEPVLYMIKVVELIVIERIDLFFLTAWAVLALTSIMCYLYTASIGVAHLFKAKTHRKSLYVLAVIAIPVATFTENRVTIAIIGDKLNNISFIFLFVIPIMLLIIALIRNKREEST